MMENGGINWIDTHAHIYMDAFDEDRVMMLERCAAANVHTVLMPNIDADTVASMLTLEGHEDPVCRPMMGLHPCSVNADFESALSAIEVHLARQSFVAIGEIGTDLYWEKKFFEQQKEALIIQTGWAKRHDLPVVLHCRESLDVTIEIMEGLQHGRLRGVFHCFTGTVGQARRIQDLGFYLGIGGVSTFKNAGLDRVLLETGLERVVLETDSPYLAPVPFRGKRNEPAYVPVVGAHLAKILEVPPEEICRVTTANATELFRL